MPLTNYSHPSFSMDEKQFMFFDFNFNSDFVQSRTDSQQLYNALALAIFAGIYNSYAIMMVTLQDA